MNRDDETSSDWPAVDEQVRFALDTASVGMWQWELDTDRLRWDETCERQFGYEPGAFPGTYDVFLSHIVADDRDTVDARVSTAIETGGEFEVDFRIDGTEGERRRIRSCGRVEESAAGKAIRLFGTQTDITDQQTRKRELGNYQVLFENTSDCIVETETTADGLPIVQRVNDAFEAVFGYPGADIRGENLDDIIVPDEYREEATQINQRALEEDQFSKEVTRQTADGRREFLMRFVSIDDDSDFVIYTDITERKEYEAALEDQRDNLDILNQVVRHDVRNNLQLVSTYTELLEGYVEPGGREYIDQVLEATRNAVDITVTARDVTEVMLTSPVETRPITLRYALEQEIDDVQSRNEDALMTVDRPIPNVDVTADDLLGSVFRNLLTNAIVHNNKDVPKVTVSTALTDDSVEIKVADNGPGIPNDRKADIFTEGEMGLDSDGTGLGLYLVETLVERYDGDIAVRDNDPDGTVFVVVLPIAK